jgi:hypothetical protein
MGWIPSPPVPWDITVNVPRGLAILLRRTTWRKHSGLRTRRDPARPDSIVHPAELISRQIAKRRSTKRFVRSKVEKAAQP